MWEQHLSVKKHVKKQKTFLHWWLTATFLSDNPSLIITLRGATQQIHSRNTLAKLSRHSLMCLTLIGNNVTTVQSVQVGDVRVPSAPVWHLSVLQQ